MKISHYVGINYKEYEKLREITLSREEMRVSLLVNAVYFFLDRKHKNRL